MIIVRLFQQKIGTSPRHNSQAAEGETVVAVIRAIRRVHTSGIKVEVVSARSSHAIISRRRRSRRPPVAVLASVPRLTIVWIEVPAAHEDYTSSNFTNRPEDTYLYLQA